MKRIERLFSLILCILLLASCNGTGSQGGETELKEKGESIEDMAGNQIDLKKPYEKVLIQGSGSGGPLMTMIALDRDNFSSKIIAMDEGMKENRNDLWTKLVEAKPELEDIKKVGDIAKNEVSAEEIAEIAPDCILAPISYKANLDEISKKTGIPAVYIDYHDQDMEKHLKSTEIIAKVTGLTKNLEEINAFYKDRVGPIVEKTKNMGEGPSVYVENGYTGPKEFSNSYGKNKMWGKIVADTGGKNILEDKLKPDAAEPVSPEYVLAEDPEIIIITGADWPELPGSFKMGYGSTEEDVIKQLDQYIEERDGWKDLKAVKDKNIYAIGHPMCRDMTDFYSYEELAKIFHPEEFKDLDPEKDIKDYYKKYMPIDFEGTWFVKYE